MRKAARPLGGMVSLNPRRWRGKRRHHHGCGVCWLFLLLRIDPWCHELIVCKKWYKNNLKMRLTALLFDPPTRAPYLMGKAHEVEWKQFIQLTLIYRGKAHEVEWKQCILLVLIFYCGKAHKVEWKQCILHALIFYCNKAHKVEWKQCILLPLIFIMARLTRLCVCWLNDLAWKLRIQIHLFDCSRPGLLLNQQPTESQY